MHDAWPDRAGTGDTPQKPFSVICGRIKHNLAQEQSINAAGRDRWAELWLLPLIKMRPGWRRLSDFLLIFATLPNARSNNER